MFFFSWRIFFFFFLLEGNFLLFLFFLLLSARTSRENFYFFFRFSFSSETFQTFFLFSSREFFHWLFFSWFTLFSLSHTARFSSDVLHASNKTPRSTEVENLLENLLKYLFHWRRNRQLFSKVLIHGDEADEWASDHDIVARSIRKKNTDQQNTENVNEAQEPGKKSKRNIRKRNFRICSPLSRAHTALILALGCIWRNF